jgi:hypothetical protein
MEIGSIVKVRCKLDGRVFKIASRNESSNKEFNKTILAKVVAKVSTNKYLLEIDPLKYQNTSAVSYYGIPYTIRNSYYSYSHRMRYCSSNINNLSLAVFKEKTSTCRACGTQSKWVEGNKKHSFLCGKCQPKLVIGM